MNDRAGRSRSLTARKPKGWSNASAPDRGLPRQHRSSREDRPLQRVASDQIDHVDLLERVAQPLADDGIERPYIHLRGGRQAAGHVLNLLVQDQPQESLVRLSEQQLVTRLYEARAGSGGKPVGGR